jgi:hypothetical protein
LQNALKFARVNRPNDIPSEDRRKGQTNQRQPKAVDGKDPAGYKSPHDRSQSSYGQDETEDQQKDVFKHSSTPLPQNGFNLHSGINHGGRQE